MRIASFSSWRRMDRMSSATSGLIRNCRYRPIGSVEVGRLEPHFLHEVVEVEPALAVVTSPPGPDLSRDQDILDERGHLFEQSDGDDHRLRLPSRSEEHRPSVEPVPAETHQDPRKSLSCLTHRYDVRQC